MDDGPLEKTPRVLGVGEVKVHARVSLVTPVADHETPDKGRKAFNLMSPPVVDEIEGAVVAFHHAHSRHGKAAHEQVLRRILPQLQELEHALAVYVVAAVLFLVGPPVAKEVVVQRLSWQ